MWSQLATWWGFFFLKPFHCQRGKARRMTGLRFTVCSPGIKSSERSILNSHAHVLRSCQRGKCNHQVNLFQNLLGPVLESCGSSVDMCQAVLASDQNASQNSLWGILLAGLVGKRPWGRTRICWRHYIPELAWKCLNLLPEELVEVAVESKVLCWGCCPAEDTERIKNITTVNTRIGGLFSIGIINRMYRVIFKYILINWNYADQGYWL